MFAETGTLSHFHGNDSGCLDTVKTSLSKEIRDRRMGIRKLKPPETLKYWINRPGTLKIWKIWRVWTKNEEN
jgi:hypothetical protein